MILKTVPVTKKLADYEKIEKLAKEAFPPAEYLAPSIMVQMAKSPDFDFLALYPNTQQVVDIEMLDEAADNAEQRKRRRSLHPLRR